MAMRVTRYAKSDVHIAYQVFGNLSRTSRKRIRPSHKRITPRPTQKSILSRLL
jgi:hypothetical protein